MNRSPKRRRSKPKVERTIMFGDIVLVLSITLLSWSLTTWLLRKFVNPKIEVQRIAGLIESHFRKSSFAQTWKTTKPAVIQAIDTLLKFYRYEITLEQMCGENSISCPFCRTFGPCMKCLWWIVTGKMCRGENYSYHVIAQEEKRLHRIAELKIWRRAVKISWPDETKVLSDIMEFAKIGRLLRLASEGDEDSLRPE